jgi:hypothetical protein
MSATTTEVRKDVIFAASTASKGIVSHSNFLEALVESTIGLGMTVLSPIVLLAVFCLSLTKQLVEISHAVTSSWYS